MLKISEAQLQQTVIEYCEHRKIPIFAIPNGGKRNAKEAYFMKLSGVKSGVPDLFIPLPCGEFSGLFIELKVGKNKPTENQVKWIELLRKNGYRVEVLYSFEEFKKIVERYIKNGE